MTKNYIATDLDFTTFEALDEGNFAINFKDDELEPSAEAVLFIDVFDSTVKPKVVVMYKDNSSPDYSPEVEFSADELKDIFAAVMKYLYLSEYGNEELALAEMALAV